MINKLCKWSSLKLNIANAKTDQIQHCKSQKPKETLIANRINVGEHMHVYIAILSFLILYLIGFFQSKIECNVELLFTLNSKMVLI